jgi:Sec-independent protein translocase protein TatA
VGFGTEILFILLLGLLVLGPRQMHALLGQVARAKAQFEAASRGFKSQLAAEIDAAPEDSESIDGTMNRDLTSDRTTHCRIEQNT